MIQEPIKKIKGLLTVEHVKYKSLIDLESGKHERF